jgi:glycosyl hydrolase family 141
MTVSTFSRTFGAVSILFLLSISQAAWGETISLYVSPVGCDDWSGSLASPNPEGADGPLATLAGARDRIRRMKADWKETSTPVQPVDVFLREGTYRIEEPVTFTPEDSGSEDAPVTYTAFPGETPVISGGRQITDWRIEKVEGRELWVAGVPEVASDEWWFREVFVDGKRTGRTRLPKEGFYCFLEPVDVSGEHKWSHGSLGAVFEEGDLREWSKLSEVEIVALTRWIETRMPVKDLDMEKNVVTFPTRSTFRLENTRIKDKAARYYVENVFEELDEPGEWFLDRAKGKVYLVPKGN